MTEPESSSPSSPLAPLPPPNIRMLSPGDIEKVLKGANTPEQVNLVQEALKRCTVGGDALGIIQEAVANEVMVRTDVKIPPS